MGIGSKLMQWGLEKADATNSRIYLDASEAGEPLYAKYGFKIVQEFVFDLASKGGQGTQKFTVMIREPRAAE